MLFGSWDPGRSGPRAAADLLVPGGPFDQEACWQNRCAIIRECTRRTRQTGPGRLALGERWDPGAHGVAALDVTAYDAVYVALPGALDCELVTGDERLANAPNPRGFARVLP